MAEQKNQIINSSDLTHPNVATDVAASEWPDPDTTDLLEGVSFFDGDDEDAEIAATRREAAITALLSLEISAQKGIAVEGDWVRIPGRADLMPFSLLETLLSVIGFSAGIIHFSSLQPNYLLPLAVLQAVLFAQIILYHSSCRAQRTTLAAIHGVSTSLIIAFVTWAFVDLIRFPIRPGLPTLWLYVTLTAFCAVPVLMLMHLFYFGRASRLLPKPRAKRSVNPAEAPTATVLSQGDIPTQIIEQKTETTV